MRGKGRKRAESEKERGRAPPRNLKTRWRVLREGRRDSGEGRRKGAKEPNGGGKEGGKRRARRRREGGRAGGSKRRGCAGRVPETHERLASFSTSRPSHDSPAPARTQHPLTQAAGVCSTRAASSESSTFLLARFSMAGCEWGRWREGGGA